MADDLEFARILLVKQEAAIKVALANKEIEQYQARENARPLSPILINTRPAIGETGRSQLSPSTTDAQPPAGTSSQVNEQYQSLNTTTSQADASSIVTQAPASTNARSTTTKYRYAPFNSPSMQTATPQLPVSSQGNIFVHAADLQAQARPSHLLPTMNAPSQMLPFTPRPQALSLVSSAQYTQAQGALTGPLPSGNQFSGVSHPYTSLLTKATTQPLLQGRTHNLLATRGPVLPAPRTGLQDMTSRRQARKRSPSFEIAEQRRRKQAREDADRIQTPPLNDEDEEPEDEDENTSSPSERSFSRKQKGGIVSRSRASPRVQSQRHTLQSTPQPRTKSQSRQRLFAPPKPAARRPLNEDYDDQVEEEVISSSAQHQRAISGTPQVIAEGQREASDEDQSTTNYANRLRPDRAQPGEQYYPVLGIPLTAAQRREVETQFIALVGGMIKTKVCFRDPPLPADTKNIAYRLQARLGAGPRGTDDDDERYQSVQDFERDVEAMLKLYAELGKPCGQCKFKRTGNDRIMCYRYRMQSIVNQRMRTLPDCLKACETEVDAQLGKQGLLDKVAEYFGQEDFQQDSHWDGVRR